MHPLVSVIMPVYNGEKYISESIESILHQTYKNFEFIIIDDGSTDSTSVLLSDYQKKDPRIKVKRFEKNQGLTICLNIGIKLARGEYIARMDADDISLPSRFEKQVEFLEKHPHVAVLGTSFSLIDQNGSTLRKYFFSNNHNILKWNLLFFNPICHPSVVFRASTIREIGGYSSDLMRAQDYDLWWRVCRIAELSNLQEQYLIMRQHAMRVTNQHQEDQNAHIAIIGQRHLSITLNRELPYNIIRSIREKPRTADEAAIAGNVMIEYALYCLRNASSYAKNQIILECLKKVLRKTLRFFLYPLIWRVWFRLPQLVLRINLRK